MSRLAAVFLAENVPQSVYKARRLSFLLSGIDFASVLFYATCLSGDRSVCARTCTRPIVSAVTFTILITFNRL